MASRAAALFLLAVGAACSASPTSSLSEPAPSNDVDAAGSDASLPGAGEDGGSDAPATSSDAGPADAGAADGGESIVVVPTCTLPTAPGAGQINTVKGVVYGADAAAQTLDVAWPMAAGLHPLVVLVHGGGWWQGDKSSFVSYAAVLASLGYVAASLDYRLVPADGGANAFPTQVSDVRCAVRHLRANAGTYGIDGARVGALGTSAGAHLAAMLGVGDGVPGLDDGTCPQVVSGPVWRGNQQEEQLHLLAVQSGDHLDRPVGGRMRRADVDDDGIIALAAFERRADRVGRFRFHSGIQRLPHHVR
jgi:acetyl esterase/lipase